MSATLTVVAVAAVQPSVQPTTVSRATVEAGDKTVGSQDELSGSSLLRRGREVSCSVLFCSVLFCSVLFCAVLCCDMLCCAVMCCVVLCCAVLLLLLLLLFYDVL